MHALHSSSNPFVQAVDTSPKPAVRSGSESHGPATQPLVRYSQAAAHMRGLISDAYQKWTTGFYDYIQALQNRIPY